ncbi:MAG: DUF2470 domain-containing protein [Pseudomonadales bacterium]|nr:DUF2470 domain-containing protein [Pseudomonadales bacterium]
MSEAAWEQHRDRIINHMNDDHVEHMMDMIRHFFSEEPTSAKLVDFNSCGFHIQTDQKTHYLEFQQPCNTPREIAMEAARLANVARENLDKIGE